MTPTKEFKQGLVAEYGRAKETLVSKFSAPLSKQAAKQSIDSTLLVCSVKEAEIVINTLPSEYLAGIYLESDALSRKLPAYVGFDFSGKDAQLNAITKDTIGRIGNFNEGIANDLKLRYGNLISDNELITQLDKHGWTANTEKRMVSMGFDKETINLVKQQTTTNKMIQILEQQGLKGNLPPNEVAKLLVPQIKGMFGDKGVTIDNIGGVRKTFTVDADGNYKWGTKKVTRAYHTTTKNYADIIARSTMLDADRLGRYQTLQQSGFVKAYRSVAVMDERTGHLDAMMHGQIVRWGEGAPYHARCYSSKTEILTEQGFKRFSKLDKTEKVFSINPETKIIELIKPIKYIKYFNDGEMRHIHNKWFDLLVTPDHSLCYITGWKHKKHTNPPITFKPAEDLSGEDVIPLTGNWHTKETKEVEINGKKYETKAFFSFLGWYMAEGSASKRKEGDRYVVGITQLKNQDYKREIYDICNALFSKVWWGKEKIYISEKSMEPFLHSLGKSYEKFIPYNLKQFGAQYLRLFLDSYLKGDGSEGNTKEANAQKDNPKWKANFKPRKVYHTSSKQLRDDISELILKCGNRPTHHKRAPMKFHEHHNGIYLTTHPTYVVNEGHTKFISNQTLKNDIVTDYNDYVYGVELPKYHTLYIKSAGKCCWSGNCRCEYEPIWKKETGLSNRTDDYYFDRRDNWFWKQHQLKKYNATLPKGSKIPNANFLPKDMLKGMPDAAGMREIRAAMLRQPLAPTIPIGDKAIADSLWAKSSEDGLEHGMIINKERISVVGKKHAISLGMKSKHLKNVTTYHTHPTWDCPTSSADIASFLYYSNQKSAVAISNKSLYKLTRTKATPELSLKKAKAAQASLKKMANKENLKLTELTPNRNPDLIYHDALENMNKAAAKKYSFIYEVTPRT